ncbi:MAG: C-GCAxxG-C-C family protein [Firmicutes bacterium]|nr:C-GCAxxG-C-C family protein [Bacillota bacterium]
MTNKEKALDYFSRKYHCSQAVLAAFADQCGLTEDQALRLGGCFGSGMRKGEVCGACTGALMVLGALYGQSDETDIQSREQANQVNDEMMNRFAEQAGSYLCKDILGCDPSTKEGIAYARENNLFMKLCPKMVAIAVDVLEEIIIMNKEKLSR